MRLPSVPLFLLLTACATPGVSADLPAAAREAHPAPVETSVSEIERTSIVLRLRHDGEISHGGRGLRMDQVQSLIAQRLESGSLPVVILPDSDVSSSLLVRVIDEAKLAGATDVRIATQRRNRP